MPTDQQGLLGVYKWDFHTAVDWWKVRTGVREQSIDEFSWEDKDKLQHMSARWRWSGKGKLEGRGERKAATQLIQGGGAVTVTRGHGTETHGNNEAVINLCANNSDSGSITDKSLSRVIVCRMYVSVDNITMLQRNVISVGIVLSRALLGGSRSGYNVSLVVVRVNVEIVISTASLHCGSCQLLQFGIYGVESV